MDYAATLVTYGALLSIVSIVAVIGPAGASREICPTTCAHLVLAPRCILEKS